MGRTYNSSRNAIFGFINRIIMILFPFVIRTIIIYKLGRDYAGLSSLFTSVLQVLSLTELGFGAAMVFNMYKPFADDDKDKICAYLYLYRKVYLILGCIILFIGLLFFPFLDKLINGDCPSDINLYVLYGIYLFNTVISYFLFSYKSSLFIASQRSDISYKIDTLVKILMFSSQIVILLWFSNYYLYILLMPLFTILNNVLVGLISKKKYPDFIPKGQISNEEKKALWNKLKSLFGHKLGGVVVCSLDSIIISSFLGLSTLSIYGNYFYIVTSINAFIDMLATAVLASIGNALIKGNDADNYILFKKLTFINAWIVGFSTIAFFCLCQDFMVIWVGNENIFDSLLTIILFSMYFYTWKIRIIGLNFKDAAGMWNNDFWKPYVGIIINLITNIALVLTIGIDGVLISTIVVMVLVYFPWETKVLFRDLFKIKCTEYILKFLFYACITFIAMTITYIVCCQIRYDNLYINLLIKALICIVLPNLIFLLSFIKTKEFKLVMIQLRGLFQKKN